MPEKIATEKELFTLGGGKETDKPTNYDINRCVTKTRSTAFKSITANLTAYQELQLIPVNLFGKVVMADTIKIELEYNGENNINYPEFDVVLLVDGKETHCTDLYNTYGEDYTMFKTYEWVSNDSLVIKTEREKLNDYKDRSIQNINLKTIKELMRNHNNATIQFKAKWYDKIPTDPTIKYTVKLLANGEERYKAQNSIQLLTHELFPVDVFFRKLFEITYDSKNDSITLLNNSDPEKTAKFEYDLLVKKNGEVLIDQHMITNSMYASLDINPKDFKQYDRIILEVSDFKIKLTMSDGTEKAIIPNFTETKVKTIEKNGFKLSVIVNDSNFYMAQIEFLKDTYNHLNGQYFTGNVLTLGDFNPFEAAFAFIIYLGEGDSYYDYYDTSDNIKGRRKNIKLF